MSIKTSADEWVRKGPTQAIAVVAAVGIIVGGLIGLGVGFKVEQSRTKDQVSKLQKQANATGVLLGPIGKRIGKVTAISGASITVSTGKNGSQTLATTATTKFETTEKGTIADVHSGVRVLVTPGGGEIIVVPAGSKLGRLVTKIDSGSITIAPKGKIKTTDVHRVETVKPAKLADIAKGDSVYAAGRAKDKNTFGTIEVIVLPDGSAFAK